MNRRQGCYSGAAIGALWIMAANCCLGQSSAGVARPFTVKVGVYSPASKETRTLFGDTHFLLEGAYDIGWTTDHSFLLGAYINSVFSASGSRDTVFFNEQTGLVNDEHDTGRASAYAIGLQSRYFPKLNGHSQDRAALNPYLGGGFGICSIYGKQGFSGYDNGNYNGDFSHITTGLEGKIMAGVESRSGFLGEISFNRLPNDEGLDLSGYGFTLGHRF